MKNVKFDKEDTGKFFLYENENGDSDRFEYRFSTDNLWNPLDPNDFIVEILINPFLNNERNVYALLDSSMGGKRVGYLFPISVLDSDADFSDHKLLNNYVYVAFNVLLKRIPSVNKTTCFSDNFEENVCVCVFHKASLQTESPLPNIIHNLRQFGYSYFEPYNQVRMVKGYDALSYQKDIKSGICVRFNEPPLYQNAMIDSILRALPRADNLTHRFVLLYQVIEVLLEEISSNDIKEEILKFNKEQIPSNDFIENIKRLSSERIKIQDIFERCSLYNTKETTMFKECCSHLFDLTRYEPSKTQIQDLFYSFRNQMTHSYRNLYVFEKELAETIQAFELLVLKIIEKYPYKIDTK